MISSETQLVDRFRNFHLYGDGGEKNSSSSDSPVVGDDMVFNGSFQAMKNLNYKLYPLFMLPSMLFKCPQMISYSPRLEYIIYMLFYPPQRETEYKTAIAESNPKNPLAPSSPKSLCTSLLR
ncbi:hypothetical protein AVEN_131613-1 [Araneus ventricosus]|uniref:Uncharacterized protein n=1 Tax=Araneus ventricosus TaxID=182803 RepID=A0A4Y2EWG4_ARAVE|nr:hypothetical protein AVEN_131613-1 [Araneus ventricosus]